LQDLVRIVRRARRVVEQDPSSIVLKTFFKEASRKRQNARPRGEEYSNGKRYLFSRCRASQRKLKRKERHGGTAGSPAEEFLPGEQVSRHRNMARSQRPRKRTSSSPRGEAFACTLQKKAFVEREETTRSCNKYCKLQSFLKRASMKLNINGGLTGREFVLISKRRFAFGGTG